MRVPGYFDASILTGDGYKRYLYFYRASDGSFRSMSLDDLASDDLASDDCKESDMDISELL